MHTFIFMHNESMQIIRDLLSCNIIPWYPWMLRTFPIMATQINVMGEITKANVHIPRYPCPNL